MCVSEFKAGSGDKNVDGALPNPEKVAVATSEPSGSKSFLVSNRGGSGGGSNAYISEVGRSREITAILEYRWTLRLRVAEYEGTC